MGSILGRKLDRGVDARRLPETTDSGALIRGINGHITRGGEFKKRAAFVLEYELPAGKTVGLAANSSSLYVFGTDTFEPSGIPDGVTWQRVQTTILDESDPVTRIVSWDLFEDKLYVIAEYTSGLLAHLYDGARVRARLGAQASITITSLGGDPGSTVDIIVDGVSATGGPVSWPVGDINLIAAVNDTTSTPDYVAESFVAGTFFLSTAEFGSAGNGRSVSIVITGTANVTSTGSELANGIEPYVNTSRYTRTIGAKEYTLSGSQIQFSAIGDPELWTTGTGFGFIDTSSYTSGAEDLTAIVDYRGLAAVFAERTIQTWSLAADPANNSIRQRLRNTGTSCPKSITQYGDGDIFYLDESGLRTLRARDASGAASTFGVGTRIDPLIVAKLRALTETERNNVIGLIEPGTGNFWLIMKDTIFVFAHFEDERISAWTTYTTHYFDDSGTKIDFDVDDAVVFDRRVYLRSGDNIFAYGGITTGQETDATEAEAWTAYLDGDDPTTTKTWRSLDAAVSGEWEISAGMNLADTSIDETIAIVTQTTYNQERISMAGQSTHISLRFKSRGEGDAVIGAFAVHFD